MSVGTPRLWVLHPQILTSRDPKILGKIAFILNMYRHGSLHPLAVQSNGCTADTVC